MSGLIIHIGLEKTGTTSFQAYCDENRARLAARGVVYPTNPLCFAHGSHAPLVASYFPPAEAARLMIGGRRADHFAAVAALRAEIAGAPTALVSAEHFSSRFDAPLVAALAADLTGLETTVAIVVRHPVPRTISSYATTVVSGRGVTLDAFVDEVCAASNPYLRSRATIEAWSAAFGREQVIVFDYREGADIVPRLVERLLPQSLAEPIALRRNASPPAGEIEQRRRANATRWPLARYWTRWLRAPPPADAARLSREQTQRIEAATADDLDWLKREYGVDFAQPKS